MRIKLKKKHKKESAKWLNRHLNDEYVLKSKKEGYRSRSSYKLIQINEKFDLLSSKKKILDLGCAPGGWLQVIRKLSNNNPKVLGIDKIKIDEIKGINFHQGDIFEKSVNNYIKSFFENNKVDLILSDMSPNSSGNKQIDHLRIISLIENVLELSDYILESDGHLVLKIFQGGAQGELLKKMKNSLDSIKYFKPNASRDESPETYLIAKKK